MKARLVVFPLKGRIWCFSRSLDPTLSSDRASSLPPTLKDLWRRVASHGLPAKERAEIVADFVADKMNRTWTGLEKAPPGTVKAKIHSLGLRLLSGVKPSGIFLKSLSDDINKVEIAYPASLNPRLVRRRLRHVALRGSTTHRKYFYGSVSLLPITTAFSVLPLPNIPFFWILFRAYSHWRAMKVRAILLDPSCSGSGICSERLDYLLPSFNRAHDADAADCDRVQMPAAFQRKALIHALSFERVVYITCSIHQTENEDVISWVLSFASSLNFELATPFPQWPRRGLPVFDGDECLLRTDPSEDIEGFFIALFVKKIDPNLKGKSNKQSSGRPSRCLRKKIRRNQRKQVVHWPFNRNVLMHYTICQQKRTGYHLV